MGYVISVDPGLDGAIAVLEDLALLSVHDMPTAEKTHGKGRQLDAYALDEMLVDILKRIDATETTVVVERVTAMPKQGVSSMFSMGRSLGVIEAIIATHGMPVVWVLPTAWKKHWSLTGKAKDAARTKVIEIYPKHRELFKLKKHVDRADAVLLGLYGSAQI